MIDYIGNQKEHHKIGTTIERLEKITNDEDDEAKARLVSTLKRANLLEALVRCSSLKTQH